MPYAMGYTGARLADGFADNAAEREIEPLAPGEDPLEAISPEMRELVTSLEPVAAAEAETTFVDRVKGAGIGIALGAAAGFLVANYTTRRHRIIGAPPMNVQQSLVFAGIGAAIGGVSGLLRGRSPLETDDRAKLATVVGPQSGLAATAQAPTAIHPAFASLHPT